MDTIRLEVSDSQVILLYLPCDKKDIVLLTDVSLTYWRDGKRVCDVFVRDYLNEAVKQLYHLLTEALNNELQLDDDFVEKGIGYFHNIYVHELWTNDDINQSDPADEFFVWSTSTEVGTETYIYNVDNEIYLEICPLYKWNCDYPDDEDEYQTFEEFLHHYQMIDLIHIERGTALQLQKILHELLEIAQANELIYRIS